jgi:hypothetical protein
MILAGKFSERSNAIADCAYHFIVLYIYLRVTLSGAACTLSVLLRPSVHLSSLHNYVILNLLKYNYLFLFLFKLKAFYSYLSIQAAVFRILTPISIIRRQSTVSRDACKNL